MKAQFVQGQDPYNTLKIGHSELYDNFTQQNLINIVRYHDYYILMNLGWSFIPKKLENTKRMYNILDDKIEIGHKFHWTKSKLMDKYIERHANGRYVYDASRDGDVWYVVFSKIKFPKLDILA